MALLTDPDFLNDETEIAINPTSRRISLGTSGNLSADGVTLQCVYSFLKEEWKSNPELPKYPFPIEAITSEQFELINNWDFTNTGTKALIRGGGWALKSGTTVTEKWMNLTTLGNFYSVNDRAYYQQSGTLGPVNAIYTGPMNQAIQIFDLTGGRDYSRYFKIFLRGQGETYASYDLLTDQGLSELTYRKYALPLSNAVDTKVAASDAFIATGAAYTGVSVTYFSSGVPRTIGTGTYLFNILVSGDSQDKISIYEKSQYLLRQSSDIDSGAGLITGQLANSLMQFVGDTLYVASGVFISNVQTDDLNSVSFVDVSGVTRTYPFTSAGTIAFNTNLQGDLSSKYWMYFTSVPSGAFGATGATLVQDKDGNYITGLVNAQSSVSFSFNYDANSQGGRTPGTDAPITTVAIGLSGAQYVSTTSSIERSVANTVTLTSASERNYLNL